MMLRIPKHLKKQRDVTITKDELVSFETEVKERYEAGDIPAPIHLAKDNEEELIEIFQYINKDDWVFQAWRNHYHALLHGFDRQELMDAIIEGRSMATSSSKNKFYSLLALNVIIEKNLIDDKEKMIEYFTKLENQNFSKNLSDLILLKKALYIMKFKNKSFDEEILKKLVKNDSKIKSIVEEIISK